MKKWGGFLLACQKHKTFLLCLVHARHSLKVKVLKFARACADADVKAFVVSFSESVRALR